MFQWNLKKYRLTFCLLFLSPSISIVHIKTLTKIRLRIELELMETEMI